MNKDKLSFKAKCEIAMREENLLEGSLKESKYVKLLRKCKEGENPIKESKYSALLLKYKSS